MRIQKVHPGLPVARTEKVVTEKKKRGKELPAAVYEKTSNKDKGHIYDKMTVDKLKKDSERAYSSLRRIVEDLLARQGKAFHLLKEGDQVIVDEQARLEAQELIGPDGILGIEAVSQRIVDFAIAISGGDKSKLDTLRKAIDDGFKAAEKMLGGLPEISKETYNRVMEKLDAWERGE
ncbi:MAG: hypothetical protein GX080_00035 [Tissierellia bacterium]|nr:hypothetical protein [Tissierellia bacterium]